MTHNKKGQWFESWFDTEYYHILYQNRDYLEAEKFITTLTDHLNLPPLSKVVDLACGKGRHSIQLAKLGYSVLGLDLSKNSISHAKQFETPNLLFNTADMRLPFGENEFDCIFNLFTSFGYFEDILDNQKVLDTAHKALKNTGILVIDFLNSEKVISGLPINLEKNLNGIIFKINKSIIGKTITKTIEIEDRDKKYCFQEKLTAFTHEDFLDMFKTCGFKLANTFGDYQLNPYSSTSERMIFILKK